MNRQKRALINSIISLVLCFSMLLGTTFAWFTDSASTAVNTIQSGTLKVGLVDENNADLEGQPLTFRNKDKETDILWEPGVTFLTQGFKVVNKGNLALKYKLAITGINGDAELLKVIDFWLTTDPANPETGKVDLSTYEGHLVKEQASGLYYLVGHMKEDAGNEYQAKTLKLDSVGITVYATQDSVESDSFGNTYDAGAEYPEGADFAGGKASAAVSVENGAVKDKVSMSSSDGSVSADVPAGVQVKDGVEELTLSVTKMTATTSNVVAEDDQILIPVDVHIDGVAEGNTKPMTIAVKGLMQPGLNNGNYSLVHVENGVSVPMTRVESMGELDAHNEFYYEPGSGIVYLCLATFSEVAVVSDTEAKWEGDFDYTWYTNAVAPLAEEGAADYVIANGDQLAAFGAIVGGMDGQTRDSFSGKTVKLICDINIGDTNSENGIVFYPIGYYNSDGTYEKTNTAITSGFKTFEGTFDGNGHTISNFYQNTWEMKGDHNWYDASLQYYRDGMGLFGKVYGGTVKNLTVDNFSSDGEIATTGVIAAYADCGATFENIAITNCNPRVYNIGNGGIVGCVGWYANDAHTTPVTFTNITVDNSNKISALWGSYDVACGGIVGQYYPTSGQENAIDNAGIHMENCHVAAQMDVYNDVCGNYQYYAYRYAGMLIGSVRENLPKDANGHVYPNMDGITASGCTVHFGDWNDYYYCEIINNTTASYTHDYQMSRLTEIKAIDGNAITYLDGTTGTVPASGRANYVIVDYTKGHGTDNATCYHFKDGAVWTHDMGGIQTGIDENGDGQDDLKEDKQHIYLEFNNLVTGYGWGVTTKVVGQMDGVVILDAINEGDSVVKFEKADNAKESYTTESTVTIGDLFKAANIGDEKLKILNAAVQVAVSPVGEDSSANGTYEANTTDWTQGTLTFSGTGAATITITDYYYCTPTTINVTITEKVAVEKFDVVLNNGDFLHRVGNSGTVTLGKLFKAKDGATIGTVSVTVEALNNTEASGTYTSNATWTDGTIQFSGTGVVKVTITDNDYCIPTELILEVVDAKNATSATSATSNNVVLLNDTSGTFTVSNGHTFYGNGFTVTLPTSSVTNKGNGFTGYVGLGAAADGVDGSGGNLDNVQIIGPVYPETYIYRTQAEITDSSDPDYGDGYNMRYFNNSVIIYGGNCSITNSYISGSRTAVYVKGVSNVTIDNTTVSGGSYANIEIGAAVPVTLKNVITVQKEVKDSYNSEDAKKSMIGMGVVVSNSGAVVTVEGALKQYNWVTEEQWDAMIPDAYASQFPDLFGTSYSAYQHTYNDTTYINLGIIFACEWDPNTQIVDKRTNTELTYTKTNVSIAGTTGGVYSITGAILNDALYNAPAYAATAQGVFKPKATFDYSTKNNEPEASGSNDYCYYNATDKKYVISFDKGETKDWYYDILTVSKGNNTLPYSVAVSGTTEKAEVNSNNTITFGAAGDYTVTYTYTDTLNYVLNDGEIGTYSAEYTQYIYVTVYEVEPEADPTTFAFGSDGYKTVTAGGLTYVMPNVTADKGATVSSNVVTASGIGSTTIGGETIYYPIIGMHKEGSTFGYYNYFSVFEAVTINDANGTSTYNTSTTTLPSNLSVIGGFILSDDTSYASAEKENGTGIFNYATGKTVTTKSVTVKGTSVGLCYYPDSSFSSTSTARPEQTIVAKYCYTDTNGKTYYYYIGYWCAQGSNGVQSSSGSGTCIAEGTMITLADGTKKAVEDLRKGDVVMAFDHVAGEIVYRDVLIVGRTYADSYYKNTFVFDDGTSLVTINEHGIYDLDLNQYVNIGHQNYREYVGHRFVSVDSSGDIGVKSLVGVATTCESGYKYDIVTNGTFNYVAEDTLSVTHEVVDIVNSFAFGDDMLYDAEAMKADIEKYGLYTYEDFAEYCDRSVFEQYNMAMMKIGVSKGYYTKEHLVYLLTEIALNEDVQIID